MKNSPFNYVIYYLIISLNSIASFIISFPHHIIRDEFQVILILPQEDDKETHQKG